LSAFGWIFWLIILLVAVGWGPLFVADPRSR
jgi:hypothetical protein